jgi:inhibitor of KinA sporulation pathway (predicted exonuclease)
LTEGALRTQGTGVPAHDGLVARARAELERAGAAILIDLEYTCWEDSLRTGWADPARPAEVIEIGLALYRIDARAVTAELSRVVRPVVNPTLTAYCLNLLHIPQAEIDAADDLPTVLPDVDAWLRSIGAQDLATCGWGNDPRLLAADAATRGLASPLAGRAHIDLHAVMTAQRHHPHPISRDELRDLAHLPPNPRRHRALDDAVDLTHFLQLLLA